MRKERPRFYNICVDAGTGRFVSQEYADANPSTTMCFQQEYSWSKRKREREAGQ